MRNHTLASGSGCSGPSETSPLLGDREASKTPTRKSITEAQDEETVDQNGTDAAREAQFRGLPDAQNQLKYIVPAISIGVFLGAADQTIIVSSYGKIGSDLQALNLTSWIATSYFLTLTSFQPLYGRLSDIFGRKACLLFAYSVFGIGCVGCGLARNIGELIAARVFQGLGGGGMSTVVSIIMSDLVPLRDRGVWQGIINIIWASGSAVGAPLGGILADYIGWRWSFLLQGPLCLLAFITVSFTLHLPVQDKSHWRQKLRRIDFLGALVLVGAVFSFLLGADRGSNVSWSIPITIVSLSLAIVLFAVFLCVEVWVASEPFAPSHIIFDRSLSACYGCNFFSFAGYMGVLFYFPLYFQATDGVSATGAGIRLLPSIIAGVSGSLFGGIVMKRTGKYFWITFVSYVLLTVGVAAIFLWSGGLVRNTVGILIGITIAAFGSGIGITTTLIALIACASPRDQAVATACSYLFRSLGSVIGLSFASTMVQQSLRTGLRSALDNNKDVDKIVNGVRQSLDYINTLDPQTREIVRNCYGMATNHAFGLSIIVVFFTTLSALFIREKALSR
ncbi:MFS multidrug transporter [Blastomyces gilchristii SLH14081]|uniref:MFS multidrug transporter n=1 Tax=Blastomyces gilchristii (strain SLH14081) TaxID=559298 RepID=A0A179UW08_BLAGS|nr:MFS multidrug transporter [Blastomyces gilchristii SLH14081]OAT11983.1 MFS multidrug transporter [Blastomyces gilchristii SLH14081]